MAVTVRVVADRGRFSRGIDSVLKKKGGGGGGVTFLARSIRNAGVLYVPTFGLDTKSGLSGEVDARDTSSQLRACV